MSNPDYGFLARTLHRVALGPRFMGQACFDLEDSAVRRNPGPGVSKPIFIAGLARSGSTILLNALYKSGVFRSLTYRDMPFVLMSGTWKKMSTSSQSQREATERAHGDRVMVDYDSPEAFEEVFWRTFYGDKYIHSDRVIAHQPPRAILKKFDRFVHHVLSSRDGEGQTRYLSKNNNNILRLSALKKVYPDALLIIPFRDPAQQARSLLQQHKLFVERHGTDKFSRDYMGWLGHYEFGLGHKRYVYNDSDNSLDPMDIDYWLQCWLDTYSFAQASAPDDAIFLGYEKTCESPLVTFAALYPRLGLDSDPAQAAAFYEKAEPHDIEINNEPLLNACLKLHEDMNQKHLVS